MVKKTKKKSDKVAEQPATDVEIKVPTAEKAKEDKELVMKADIRYTSEVVVMNHSQNFICLADKGKEITLAPREIKKVSKDLLNELMKNPMVRRIFDKGIVSHNADESSKVVSASIEHAPDYLKEAVEKHEDGQTVRAEVKKFEKDGTVNIELG